MNYICTCLSFQTGLEKHFLYNFESVLLNANACGRLDQCSHFRVFETFSLTLLFSIWLILSKRFSQKYRKYDSILQNHLESTLPFWVVIWHDVGISGHYKVYNFCNFFFDQLRIRIFVQFRAAIADRVSLMRQALLLFVQG